VCADAVWGDVCDVVVVVILLCMRYSPVGGVGVCSCFGLIVCVVLVGCG